MTAAYRLKGIGWFAGCTAIVLGFYLVSLQVASERKKLERLNADISSTQRDIRALETEFDTRSNLAQLERWNGDTLSLSAPVPGQFLHDAAELASAEVIRGAGAPTTRTAALIVPSFVVPTIIAPVEVAPASAVMRRPGVVVAALIRRASVQLRPQAARPASAPAVVQPPERVAVAEVIPHSPVMRPTFSRVSFETIAEPTRSIGARMRPQVALLDRKLLSDSTLRDLVGGARAEGGKLR